MMITDPLKEGPFFTYKITVSKHHNYDYTDCFVLCTPTIHPNIRIMLQFWGVSQGHSPTTLQAQVGSRPFDTLIFIRKCVGECAICFTIHKTNYLLKKKGHNNGKKIIYIRISYRRTS